MSLSPASSATTRLPFPSGRGHRHPVLLSPPREPRCSPAAAPTPAATGTPPADHRPPSLPAPRTRDPGQSDRSALGRQPLPIRTSDARYPLPLRHAEDQMRSQTTRVVPSPPGRPPTPAMAASRPGGRVMARNVIIAGVSSTPNQAYEAARDIDRSSDVKSGAIVEKDPLGNVSVLDSQDLPTAWGLGGAAGGALIGALVGLLAGSWWRGRRHRGGHGGSHLRGGGRSHRGWGDRHAGGPDQLGAEDRLSRYGGHLSAAGQDGGGGRGRGRLHRPDRRRGGPPMAASSTARPSRSDISRRHTMCGLT